MELRWENFGIERRDGDAGLSIAIPDTTSLRHLAQLSECTGSEGLRRLCLDSANILHATATLLFEDWALKIQRDDAARSSGAVIDLDVTSVHRAMKRESVPEYIVRGDQGVLRDLLSFSGELPRDLNRIADGLEVRKPEAALEIGFNLRNLQLVLHSNGGRLLFCREDEALELPVSM